MIQQPIIEKQQENEKTILIPVGLDMGSSGTKAKTTIGRTDYFPSVITTRNANIWNDNDDGSNKSQQQQMQKSSERNKRIVDVGNKAIESGKTYGANTIFPISYGCPVDINGYVLLAEHALKNMGLEKNISNVCLVVGLPYEAVQQKDIVKNAFESKLKVKKCIVEVQARGTLRSQKLDTGIIFNIGYGTTEAAIFDDSQIVAGNSIPFAVNTIMSGLMSTPGIKIDKTSLTNVVQFGKYEKESRPYASEIADAILRWYTEKMILAKHDYKVVISGGGIMNNAIRQALQKTGIKFDVPKDPLYSNVTGHFMRADALC